MFHHPSFPHDPRQNKPLGGKGGLNESERSSIAVKGKRRLARSKTPKQREIQKNRRAKFFHFSPHLDRIGLSMKPDEGMNAHGGQGQLAVLNDPHHERADIRLVNRAVREGWPVSAGKRPEIVQRMEEIVAKRECTVMTKQGPVALDGPADSNSIMAANVLLGMTKHNLGDIHHQEKQGNDNQRLENETFAAAAAAYSSLSDAEKVAMAVAAGKVDKLPPRLRAMVPK